MTKSIAKKSERIDSFLREVLKEDGFFLSKSQIKLLIKKEAVILNNKPIKKSGFILNIDDKVEVEEEDIKNVLSLSKLTKGLFEKQEELKKKDLLVFENANIFALDKPPCMHTVRQVKEEDLTENSRNELTLADCAVSFFPEALKSSDKELDGGAINRLDYYTSGLVFFAKNKTSWNEYHKLFLENKIEKTYIALSEGRASFEEKKLVNKLKLKKNSKKTTALEYDFNEESVSENPPATLEVKVLKKFNKSSLLQVKANHLTRHQIRAQLAFHDLRLLGDSLYGAKESLLKFRKELEGYDFIKTSNFSNCSDERLEEFWAKGFYLRGVRVDLSEESSVEV